MSLPVKYRVTAKCNECDYSGTLADLELHSCDIQKFGGRCEDYPCCGHTDGDGCQTLASHTSAYYFDNPQFLHEPGSPEWYEAMDDEQPDAEEDESWRDYD